eukprot:gnl/TRDRNA2_/TRDRNA2_193662_c0_seq1.p1 gnl/TRDRNA2_/TRDRNA2_193662_c0~~gnl/TRDRNA2_/TRDRNA2_193662_c0_seq1.p1  ORF type:complete len:145 (-),score=30.28 gnl/TRDRNA2_/TRDRNA2_193662_c0_seq1:108-542(-)
MRLVVLLATVALRSEAGRLRNHSTSPLAANVSSLPVVHFSDMSAHAGMSTNATINATVAARSNATGTFSDSCAKACDRCFAEHAMECYATCYRGLQAYCKDQCTTRCKPMWSATPGTGNGQDRKFCDGAVGYDGCPQQPYSYND